MGFKLLLVKSTQFSARRKSAEKILVEGTVPEFRVGSTELSRARVARMLLSRRSAPPLLRCFSGRLYRVGCTRMLPGQVDFALGRSIVGRIISV